MKPKRAGRCDRCHGALIIRKDDRPDTIMKRLAIDRKAARPLLSYYRRHGLLYRVNGAGFIGTVFTRALKLFRRHGWLIPPPVHHGGSGVLQGRRRDTPGVTPLWPRRRRGGQVVG